MGDVWPSRAAEKRPLAVPRCVRPLSVDGPHCRRCRGAGRGGTGRKAHLEARRPTAPHYGSAGLADDLRTGLLQTRRRLVEGAPPFAFPVHCSTYAIQICKRNFTFYLFLSFFSMYYRGKINIPPPLQPSTHACVSVAYPRWSAV